MSVTEQRERVLSLQSMRDSLLSESRKKKQTTRKKRTQKPVKFDNPELAKIFATMGADCQELVKKAFRNKR